jgi:hypothetical protein
MTKKKRESLIINLKPEDYQIFDNRIKKPVTFQVFDELKGGGSMVLQETDEVNVKNIRLDFFTPNNVSILLSISSRSLKKANDIFDNKLNPDKNTIEVSKATDKLGFLKLISKDVCDYIEEIQASIVFAYTALEAFANLSIPEDYYHIQRVNNKGIDERYDKAAIERWITLSTKLSTILPKIYRTKAIDKDKSWSLFVKLEKYRHEIIHQKSIEHTEFYKHYFQKDIFDVCTCAEKIIKFFYDNHSLEKSNPLWPWIVGKEKEFPSFKGDPKNFEVVGNIYEGKKKR